MKAITKALCHYTALRSIIIKRNIAKEDGHKIKKNYYKGGNNNIAAQHNTTQARIEHYEKGFSIIL